MGYENHSALSYVTVLFPVGDNKPKQKSNDALGLSTVPAWFKMNVCLKCRCTLIMSCGKSELINLVPQLGEDFVQEEHSSN